MARYPALTAGLKFTAALANAMIPDLYVKETTTSKVNNTFADDPELSAIPLAVGTWYVKLLGFWTTTGSATPDLKTNWSFTGTWNNPIRGCYGPGTTNTAARTDVTVNNWNGAPAATACVYGSPASSGYNIFVEECLRVVVTVTGNLALSWAQNTTDAANATVMQAGSGFLIKQIA